MNDFIGIGGGFAVNNATGTQTSPWDVINTAITAAATSYQSFIRSQNPYGAAYGGVGGVTGQCPAGYYLSPTGQCVPLQNYTSTSATNWLPFLLIGGLVLAFVLLRK